MNIKTFQDALKQYQQPELKRSVWQICTSIVPYVALCVLMYFSLFVSYWLTLLLALPASGFLVRIFIIQHDCAHGSYFKSKRANEIVGSIAAFMTFTPFYGWRHEHNLHHASSGDLDRRGTGDIWTMTIQEYAAAPWYRKLMYRGYRNPVVMLGLGPLFFFLLFNRFTREGASKRERRSVLKMNLAILGWLVLMSLTIGLPNYLLIQLPLIHIAGAAGIWLFYVQHQFEGVYWERHEDWDYLRAAMEGSSYYRLPKVLQWFSGNIGFHHIHHLAPKIPNYHLEKCYRENDFLRTCPEINLWTSLKSIRYRLWDEENCELIAWRDFKKRQRALRTAQATS